MNYSEALSYLYSFTDWEKKPAQAYQASHFDLRRMEQLLALKDNPHRRAKTVHVAGTKGKGSIAAMVASVLRAAGYRTGVYTSPHLHTIRERVCVDGQMISEEDLASAVASLQPAVAAVEARAQFGHLTTFEVLTALAFACFAERQVEWQVVEVGLGGRLDATNVVEPQVCVITPISRDHTEVLGPTLTHIAREKAGIIKGDCPVVASPQPQEALAVIRQVVEGHGADLVEVGKDVTWERMAFNLQGQSFQVWGRTGHYYLTTPLMGAHQVENAATAVAALEALRDPKVEAGSIAAGMARVDWPGRLEVLRKLPLVVADGAHNDASALRLREAVQESFQYRRLLLVLGTSSDKDIDGIVSALAPLVSQHLLASAEVMDDQSRRHDPVYLAVLETLTRAWS
ncbi:MAG: folylpolyglutamate synthase/dihydrofolate synthase family protein, partial [Chloroflexota bacterium]|nr:folylpolyglutamate synthase/dihydrofolate synthase family protein [Chloroflexota bacterium]